MFSKVLIPLDGSERARLILGHLRPLLLAADSRVVLFQAAPYPATPGSIDWIPSVDLEPAARDYIEREAAALRAEGIAARGRVLMGPPAACILEAIREEEATLVALTTHGRTGAARFVLGSVAEEVIRSSPAPVIAIRSFPPERSHSANLVPSGTRAPRRILAPLDGGETTVASPVIALARQFDSRVTILLVHQPGKARGGSPRTEAAGRALRQLADAGVAAEVVETSGDPASQILRTARESGADWIAMATHGRSGPARWILGSVTEKVLRASEAPLLIVRTGPLKPGRGFDAATSERPLARGASGD